MTNFVEINGRRIGPGYPVYIVAEMSANHNQDFDQAVRLMREMKDAGADAVKLQTYTPDTMTLDCDQEWFQVRGGTLWDGRSLYDLYREAHMPWPWQPKLKKIADAIGLDLFSSAFDPTAVDFLDEMGVPAHKVASFELVDLALIERMARSGKPLIMSTGMASLAEIDEAVRTARRAGATDVALLKCTSAYPALPASMNLSTIPHLADTFDVVAGLSDHTLGTAVPVASVAIGACIIEKHVCLSRRDGGPDAAFSLEPHELATLVRDVRMAQQALGRVRFGPGGAETAGRTFRRSLFVTRDVAKGEIFTDENVRSLRPGLGAAPKELPRFLGRRAARDLRCGTPLTWDLAAEPAAGG